jgi:hypothetical protein
LNGKIEKKPILLHQPVNKIGVKTRDYITEKDGIDDDSDLENRFQANSGLILRMRY